MTATTTTNLNEALAYAARGWCVVALHTPQADGSCSCGKSTCDSIGKHPRWDAQLLPNGLKNATTDPGVVQVWWALWPDANIGIVTGAASGFWALDIDPQHGGDLSLEQIITQYGTLPETVEATTGSGGSHLLFSRPVAGIRNRVKFAPGLDTRGDGGYIVAAPSLHASGQRYTWRVSPDDAPLADAPQWLLDLVCPPVRSPSPGAAQAAMNGHHAALPKRTLTYIVFGAQKGDRNTELYHAAQQCYAAGYTQAETDKLLRPRALQDGLADLEIDKTIASAYQSMYVSGPAQNPQAAQQQASTAAGSTGTAGQPGGPQKLKYSQMVAQTLASLGYSFRLNLCSDTIEVNDMPITSIVAAQIRTDARDAGIKSKEIIKDTYTVEAARNAYHPIKDYFNGLIWDGGDHIAELAAAFQSNDPPVVYADSTTTPLIHVYLHRWLIGVVAKALDAHQNMMLVLAGPQGIGKSVLSRWLCSSLLAYFIEAPINPNDKDTDVRLMNHLLWEVSELDATTRRADVSALKAFITKRVVIVRKAFGEHDTIKPALASLIGTVNESTGFLSDETGNRRFLVASIERIDWAYQTRINVDQIWAEAVARYRAGEPWMLERPESQVQAQQNRLHEAESVLEGWITEHFYIGASVQTAQMTASEIIDVLRMRHDIRLHGSERAQAMELSRVLAHLGVRKVRTNTWRGYVGIMPK
jgi:hypothetical protein